MHIHPSMHADISIHSAYSRYSELRKCTVMTAQQSAIQAKGCSHLRRIGNSLAHAWKETALIILFQVPTFMVFLVGQAADSSGSVGKDRHDLLNVLGARNIRGDDEAHLADHKLLISLQQ